jgi:uncharacterized membrane protein
MNRSSLAGMLGLALFASLAHGDGGQFTTIDVPNAILTVAYSINSRGDIVGNYVDSADNSRGFLLRQGNYTIIDVPNGSGTRATGINALGDIVGWYVGGSCAICTGVDGFLLRGGIYTNIDVPNALATEVFGINDLGACPRIVLS